MKVKEWFKNLLSGMAIGASGAIPGVSGGTIAVILKVYEKILLAVNNIFKQFKRAVLILLPILLGVILAVIPTIYLMHVALDSLLFAVICMFAGFIIGSIPGIYDEVKEQPVRKKDFIFLAVALIVAVMLGVGSVISKVDVSSIFFNPPVWLYFVLIPIGVSASSALVVPGISGSMLLLLIGFYEPLIDSTVNTVKECLSGNWTNFGSQLGILVCFGVGVVIGFYLFSKLMHYLLNKFRQVTFYAIIGFVIGSTIALFFNYNIFQYYLVWSGVSIPEISPYLAMYIEIPIGVVLLIGAAIGSYALVRIKRKQVAQEETKDLQ